MVQSLITVTRKMAEQFPDEAHKRCARYHALVRRDRWSDDRGNLCRSVYSKGNTHYWFTVLNGELIESGWMYVRGG